MSSPDAPDFRARVIALARDECEEIRRERDEAHATIVRLESEFSFPYRILREADEKIEPLVGTAASNASMSIALDERDEEIARLKEALSGAQNATRTALNERDDAVARAEALTQQLESDRKEPTEGGPKSPGPPTEEDEGRSPERKSPVTVTLEQARDWACAQTGEFSRSDLIEHFDLSGTTATRLMNSLAENGSIRRPNGSPTMGRTARWERAPLPKNAPTTKPRSSPSPSRRTHAPTPVPGTGVPAGPASTPGALKRQQRKARRVKPKIVKGVRA